MKHFLYKIKDDEIKESKGEIMGVPPHYIEYKNTNGAERIYYNIENGEITEVIGEGFQEDTARARVEDFISGLNVNLF